MKKCALVLFLFALIAMAAQAAPLRVFIRSGPKSHGPGAHDHPSFLRDWVPLLNARGAKADGSLEFPTVAQLDNTDVLIIHCDHGGNTKPEQQAAIEKFVKRGGGLVVIHAGCVGDANPEWYANLIGGSWRNGQTKWLEGPMSLYFTDQENPITQGASNFDLDDEIYYDMDLSEKVRVLAAAYTPNPKARNMKANAKAEQSTAGGKRVSVYDIQPQMWTYENTLEGGKPYRAFVSIPGHLYTNFARPNFRAILMRGIAWAGGREKCDELCSKEELASLRYPEDGPSLPAKTLAKTVVHPDFKMNLVATEPLINKVMNVDWDGEGRMWCVETPEYPNGRRVPRTEPWKESGSLVKTGDITNRPPADRVSILIDSDGDGIADKKQIFFEGLELVTSMVLYQDGVIVCAAPDIIRLRDTDGDGKADKVEKLYTGLGNGDTHAVINNLRWGFDGWIYATLGYSAGHPKSPDGTKDFGNMGAGVVRFKPDGSAFEQVCSKASNTWGLDITWDNEIFFTQPTCGQVFMHVVVPENVLARGHLGKTASWKANVVGQKTYPSMTYEKQAYVQIDQVGKFTAAAGCAMYDGGAWPKEWNYSYFTTEPTINIVNHEFTKPNGVTYDAFKQQGREETEFMQGNDYWWRPIETRIGPDGALYIVDFYNQAVIHNDTRGPQHGPGNAAVRPDRDHYFGRVWRVQHKDAKTIMVPKFTVKSSTAELLAMFEHPNRPVRNNAYRLLVEGGKVDAVPALAKIVASQKSPESKVLALWALERFGKLDVATLSAGLSDSDAAVRKNALEVAAFLPAASVPVKEIAKLLDDADARVRLKAVIALGVAEVDAATIQKLVSMFAKADDDWTKSAIVGVAAANPAGFLAATLAAPDPEPLKPLVSELSNALAGGKDPTSVAKAVISLASQPASADSLKQAMLATLVGGTAPAWSPELKNALAQLLASPNAGVAAAALPLVAAWDSQHSLVAESGALVKKLIAKLDDANAPVELRTQIAGSLIAARSLSADIVPAAIKSLTSANNPAIQSRIITALGESGDAAVGAEFVSFFAKTTDASLREALLNQLTKRTDWSLALVDAIKAKTITLTDLGPVALGRLRAHPDRAVSEKAMAAIDELRGPQLKAKDDVIAKYLPVAQQQPNLLNGKQLFTAMCLICHQYKGEGKKEFAPDLTGMGMHPLETLLTSVVDPNREVDPSFLMHAITTTKGESFSGILVRENAGSVLLRGPGGDMEIKTADITNRRNTGLSLMPEGLDAVGPENMRDIIGYLSSDSGNFRVLDLSRAFNQDSRRGLYMSEEAVRDNLDFKKFGLVQVKGVPFNIVNPAKSSTGKNVVTLKGGGGYAKTMPQKADVKVGFAASRLHFLGGIAGWGSKGSGEPKPVMKITVVYADKQTEEFVTQDGVEFADYIGEFDVPGSMLAEGLVNGHQVRAFTKVLKHGGVIDHLELESFNNHVAPTTVAITAEIGAGAVSLSDSNGEAKPRPVAPKAAPSAFNGPVPVPPAKANGPRVLIVGGGSSHNFDKFFNIADKAILSEIKPGWLDYTDNANGAADVFANVDVLVWSANQRITDTTAKALKAWADAGKPLVLLHPGVWYNWGNFPAWNKEIVGGGTRGHDAIAEFEIKTVNANHPVMAGVSASFKITDELYNMIPDPTGTPIDVLATATSPKSGKTFPSVWIVKHPKARIVCIAPGHDARAHDLPDFKKILQNAVNWAVGK